MQSAAIIDSYVPIALSVISSQVPSAAFTVSQEPPATARRHLQQMQ